MKRARWVVASAVAVSVLATTSACGDGDDGSTDKPTASASADRQKGEDGEDGRQGGVPTETQLRSAAFDLDGFGGYKVSPLGAGARVEEKTAAEAACEPLADLHGFSTVPEPSALQVRSLTTTDSPEDRGLVVNVGLFSYPEPVAKKLLTGLRDAVEACGGGFEDRRIKRKWESVESFPAPEGGDGSVEYALWTKDREGKPYPSRFTVFRSGPVLAVFHSANSADPEKGEVPEKILRTQLSKLEEITG